MIDDWVQMLGYPNLSFVPKHIICTQTYHSYPIRTQPIIHTKHIIHNKLLLNNHFVPSFVCNLIGNRGPDHIKITEIDMYKTLHK